MKPTSLVGEHTIAEMLKHAETTPAGCFVEVGVYKGGTAWHLNELAKKQQRKLYLYDTFCGMPYRDETVDSHRVGDFGDTTQSEVAAAIPEAIISAGIFPLSALVMEPVAFAHLDCDQYQSVKDSVIYLLPLMVQGGIIWFDDPFCLDGATKALKELFTHYQVAECGKAYVTVGKDK